MAFYWCILIDLLLLWFFFGNWLLENLLPKRLVQKRQLRAAARALRTRIRRDRDLLSETQRQELLSFAERLDQAVHAQPTDACATADTPEKLLKAWQELHFPEFRHHSTIANNLEILLVSVGVAFGLRSLLIQPFKIPTGSMQPTLYGIHFVQTDALPESKLASLFDFLNYSRRYFELRAPEDGYLDLGNSFSPLPSKPLFPKTEVVFLGVSGKRHSLTIPATVTDAQKLFYELTLKRRTPATIWPFEEGERILCGAMEAGDHLFVNRMSLAFEEPKRGDIMVFSTEDLSFKGTPLNGTYYVKRLVGLPGDTLKIQNRTLYVKPQRATDFFPLDGTVSRAFERIHAQENGYTGHSVQPNAAFLRYDGEEYTVPQEMYFLMGDNTDNSLDCRFFGPVARKRLVGKPCLVWWPFSDRFAMAFDRK